MNKSKNFSGQPIIKQFLKLIPNDVIARTVAKNNVDRYYKAFKTYDHLVTMLYVTLSGVGSLSELSTVLLSCKGRIGYLILKDFPRHSTLFDANRRRSNEVFADIYYRLLRKYHPTRSPRREST